MWQAILSAKKTVLPFVALALAAASCPGAEGDDLLSGRGSFDELVSQTVPGDVPFRSWHSRVTAGKYAFGKQATGPDKWALEIRSLPGGGVIAAKALSSQEYGPGLPQQ